MAETVFYLVGENRHEREVQKDMATAALGYLLILQKTHLSSLESSSVKCQLLLGL